MIWRENEWPRIRTVRMDNLRGLLCIGRMGKVPNKRIKELRVVAEGVDESVLRCFGHVERMENDRIAKRVYLGECLGSCLVGGPQKRWIDSVNNCLQKRALDVGQTRRMLYDRNEWPVFVKGNVWGIARGMNPWL